MRFPKPWYRPSRGVWYVTVDGKQHNLGPDRDIRINGSHFVLSRRRETSSHETRNCTSFPGCVSPNQVHSTSRSTSTAPRMASNSSENGSQATEPTCRTWKYSLQRSQVSVAPPTPSFRSFDARVPIMPQDAHMLDSPCIPVLFSSQRIRQRPREFWMLCKSKLRQPSSGEITWPINSST